MSSSTGRGDLGGALEEFKHGAPPPPAVDRMRQQVMRRVRRRAMARRAAAGGGGALVMLLALVVVSRQAEEPQQPTLGSVVLARGVQQDGESLWSGDSFRQGPLDVSSGGEATLSYQGIEAEVRGPARLHIEPGQLTVQRGEGTVRGALTLKGGSCEAEVDGEARFEMAHDKLQIVAVAGFVKATSAVVTCEIIDLKAPVSERADAPAEVPVANVQDDAVAQSPVVPQRKRAVRRARKASAGTSCDLGAQANAYRRAMALSEASETASALRKVRAKWRGCPLSHEVDLALIETLLRGDQKRSARAEAQRFLKRYPASPRRADVRELLQAQK